MDEYEPVEKVLLIDELLETILEYAAAGEDWGWSSNLRLVSKRWRSLSIRGIFQSTQVPQVCIRAGTPTPNSFRTMSSRTLSLETFRNTFPTTIPSELTLEKPDLPIELKIERYPTPEEFSLIQENARQIVIVIVAHPSLNPGVAFGVRTANHQLESPLKLFNLRKIHVEWQNAVGDAGFEEIVELFGNSTYSEHISFVKYEYPANRHSGGQDLPEPPSNLTHLSYTGSVPELSQLTSRLEKPLCGLVFKIVEGNNIIGASSLDCSPFTGILQRHCKSLEILTIQIHSKFQIFLSGSVQLDYMESLESLDSEVPLSFKEEDQMSKLKRVAFTVGNPSRNFNSARNLLQLSSKSLELLELKWVKPDLVSDRLSKFKIHSAREERFLWELDHQGLPFCPQLKELTIFKFPLRVGIRLMQKVYEKCASLTKLCLNLERGIPEDKRFSIQYSDYSEVFTGGDLKDIPTDELMWPMFLIQRNGYSITSLQNLKFLKLETTDGLKVKLEPFVFKAGFMQMPKLQSIVVDGGIRVDEDMINEWKKCGRSIDTDKSELIQRNQSSYPPIIELSDSD